MNTVVIWMNLLGAAGAGWTNLWAVWVWRESRAAVFYVAMAFLAWFYAWGYIYLLVSGNVLTWSAFFRTVSIAVWPLVWAAPSIAASRVRRRDLCALRESTVQISRALDERDEKGLTL